MRMTLPDEVTQEITRLCKERGGIIPPHALVEAAADEHSPLHPYFDWEDSVAAAKWRLHQARNLLRAVVTVIDQVLPPVRAFVSLQEDRHSEGGYRPVRAVLGDAALRQSLLGQAIRDALTFRRKYHTLVEAAQIIAAIDAFLQSQNNQPLAATGTDD